MSHHPRLTRVLLTGITLALSACTTGPDLDIKIHDSERGSVYVERISDRSFQAAHPISLSPDIMARVLRGVVVKESPGVLGNMVSTKREAVRAFGDEDVDYLAPLLVEGLTKAAADQQVAFRVIQVSTPSNPQSSRSTVCLSSVRFPNLCASEITQESTGGSLYARERSLYLTLSDYRHRSDRTESDNPANRPIYNSAGLGNYTVQFNPESAKRPESYRTARSTDATLVIDYNLLATMPMPIAQEVRSTAAQPAVPVKSDAAQRDTDMDEMRKELRDIKKKLAEQEAERTRSTPSPSQKSTPQSIP